MANLWRGMLVLPSLATLLIDSGAAYAAISTTGNVTPDPNTTTSSQTLYVGRTSDGTMTVDGGSVVASATSYLAHDAGVWGSATITGENSQWEITGNLFIGLGGIGELTVADGGALSSTVAHIDNGKLIVSGSGSTWTNTEFLLIAGGSNAELLIEKGAQVSSATVSSFSTASRIGLGYGSTGKATVTGPGSTWTHPSYLTVGADGDGLLTISNGGRVSSFAGRVGGFSFSSPPAGSGTTVVTGTGSAWHMDQYIQVGTNRPGMLTISDGGQVSSMTGEIGTNSAANGTVTVTGDGSRWTIIDDLYVGRSFGNGSLSIGPGGTVSVGDAISINSSSRLNLEGGTLVASSMPPNPDGRFNWTSGTLHVGQYNGNLTNSAGVLAPGQSAGRTTITGDYTQQAAGVLEIEIGGTLAGSEHDTVTVDGRATFGGQLELLLINNFIPDDQQTFTVLTAGTSLSGAFNNVASGHRLLTADGLGSFLVHYGAMSPFNPKQVVLTNFESSFLAGDFNRDGTVDAADYVVWRKTLSGNSAVDDANYAVWSTNFGRTAAQLADSTRVPEPAPVAIVCALLTTGYLMRVRPMYQRQRAGASPPPAAQSPRGAFHSCRT